MVFFVGKELKAMYIKREIFCPKCKNKVATYDGKATVNIIRDFQVVEKKKLVMPEEIHGIAKCRNPKCVTNHQPIKTWFKTIEEGNEISLLCHYCEKITDSKHIF